MLPCAGRLVRRISGWDRDLAPGWLNRGLPAFTPFRMPAPSSSAPVDVVCAVIRRQDGRILVAQRPAGKHLAGFWEFPGGKIDPGETPEAALHRELEEELGCAVDIEATGPLVLHAYDWGSIRLHPFLCRLASRSPAPQAHEHSALDWIFQKNLSGLSLAPADVPVVKWLVQMA